LDAKSPDEKIEDYQYQVSSYALNLNQKYNDDNPVSYTILTNGNLFVLYS
jgi:type I restriction enzyme M protein